MHIGLYTGVRAKREMFVSRSVVVTALLWCTASGSHHKVPAVGGAALLTMGSSMLL